MVVADLDDNHPSWNLIDALLHTMYSVVERSGGTNVRDYCVESGWPSAGDADASAQNAGTYTRNLINHVKRNGTPKRPGKLIEAYMFQNTHEKKLKLWGAK